MWILVTLLCVTAYLAYKFFSSSKKNIWKEYGVREIDTSKKVSIFDVLVHGVNLYEADKYAYETMEDDKFCGCFEMGFPRLIIKDLDLVKKILIKDFDYFADRRMFFNDKESSLGKMLPTLEGDAWRGVRTAVSPTFTTGKIRRMHRSINAAGTEWIAELKENVNSSETGSVIIDVSDTSNKFTVKTIASAVFGIKADESIFAKMAGKIVDVGKWKAFKFMLSLVFPTLFKLSGLSLLDPEAINFFETILKQQWEERVNGKVVGDDFLQLMLEAKKGELKAVGSDELNVFEKDAQITPGNFSGDSKQYLTDDIINAQFLVFFLAGFGSTSTFISLTCYLLAAHADVQQKLRDELDKVVKEDGTLDYDDVNRLVYLDMVTCEVLRLYPIAERYERKCVKEYRDPDSGLTAPKGVFASIPAQAIHRDKRYYEKPDEFYPEHFTPESKAGRNPYAYMPFGMGPRNCIGMRFAQVGSKTAIAMLVHNFVIEPTSKTPIPVQMRSTALQSLPPVNLELKLTPRKINYSLIKHL